MPNPVALVQTQTSIQSLRNGSAPAPLPLIEVVLDVETKAPPDAQNQTPQRRPRFRRQVSLWVRASSTLFGVILCIFCAMAYSTNSLIAKLLMTTGDCSPYFVTFTKQFFIGLFVLPISSANGIPLVRSKVLKNHWKPLAIRCLFGGSSLIFFLALFYAPLSDVGVIFTSTLPIFSSILSRIIFKEPFRYTDGFFMLTTFTGVLLILRPPLIFPPELAADGDDDTSLENRLIGGSCALLAAFFQSIVILSVRQMSREVHYSAIVFWNSLVGSCVAFVVMLAVDGFQSPDTYLGRTGIVLGASAGMLGQAAATLAVRYISPVIASLTSSIELAFLFFYQMTFLNVYPHLFSILGSSIIVFVMVSLVLRSLLIDKLNQFLHTTGETFSPGSRYHKLFLVLTK